MLGNHSWRVVCARGTTYPQKQQLTAGNLAAERQNTARITALPPHCPRAHTTRTDELTPTPKTPITPPCPTPSTRHWPTYRTLPLPRIVSSQERNSECSPHFEELFSARGGPFRLVLPLPCPSASISPGEGLPGSLPAPGLVRPA